jgi:hypothetical protein
VIKNIKKNLIVKYKNMDIVEEIKKERPSLSEGTIKAYTSNLRKLHEKITGKKDIENLDFLKSPDVVLEKIDKLLTNTQKNYLVAVVVILQTNKQKYKDLIEIYQKKIKNMQEAVNDKYDENEKSSKQANNWADYQDILKLLKKLKKETKPLLEKDPENLTQKEKDLIQNYLVVYLYSGKAFPIIRNDFADMKIVNESDERDDDKNYFVVKKKGLPYFQLNEFKTKKYQGEKIIPIKDLELRKLINKWAKITNTGYLLINVSNNSPMKANGISKYLQKIYLKNLNKKISTSLLRSIFITNKYDKNLSQKEKKNLAENMGHSKNTAEQVYNKIN